MGPTNLPKRNPDGTLAGEELVCKPDGDGFVLHNGEWLVCRLDAATPEGIAKQIAWLVKDAMDTGFEQGRRHVRAALGVEEPFGRRA